MKAPRSRRSELFGASAVLLGVASLVLNLIYGLINEPRWFYWGIGTPFGAAWLVAMIGFCWSRLKDAWAHDAALNKEERRQAQPASP